MSKSKSIGLSALFLAIALFVSGTLLLSLRDGYAPGGHSLMFNDALHILQRT